MDHIAHTVKIRRSWPWLGKDARSSNPTQEISFYCGSRKKQVLCHSGSAEKALFDDPQRGLVGATDPVWKLSFSR